MRTLLDNCLSPQLEQPLELTGLDVEHVALVGLGGADDSVILDYARQEDRVVITQDRDFSILLAGTGLTRPSLVYLRLSNQHFTNQLHYLVTHLPNLEPVLLQGAIAVIRDGRVRVRMLPIP